ncbi:MAG: metallophosphoesterase [Synechococcales bacterium]|nr:metallophosphoesterase [Synechococcales bacterium]
MGKRLKGIIQSIALGGLGLLGLLTVWGLIEPQILDRNTEVAVIPNLPPAWEGQQIAQLSDFQIGMWLDNEGTVRRSIQQVIRLRPAAVLLSGDFVYHPLPAPIPEIDRMVALVEPLTEAGIPAYAVLGNHDYGDVRPNAAMAARIRGSLEGIGVTVLENEAVALPPPDGSPMADPTRTLYLVGIGSYLADNDDVDAAFQDIPSDRPRIVMMHHPATFRRIPRKQAPFAIAGHTHGGQIRLPLISDWLWLDGPIENAPVAGWSAADYGRAHNHLYVNRGIGFSNLPLRINAPPELTIFTLQSQPSP